MQLRNSAYSIRSRSVYNLVQRAVVEYSGHFLRLSRSMHIRSMMQVVIGRLLSLLHVSCKEAATVRLACIAAGKLDRSRWRFCFFPPRFFIF